MKKINETIENSNGRKKWRHCCRLDNPDISCPLSLCSFTTPNAQIPHRHAISPLNSLSDSKVSIFNRYLLTPLFLAKVYALAKVAHALLKSPMPPPPYHFPFHFLISFNSYPPRDAVSNFDFFQQQIATVSS